jgi:hypothetical protein
MYNPEPEQSTSGSLMPSAPPLLPVPAVTGLGFEQLLLETREEADCMRLAACQMLAQYRVGPEGTSLRRTHSRAVGNWEHASHLTRFDTSPSH